MTAVRRVPCAPVWASLTLAFAASSARAVEVEESAVRVQASFDTWAEHASPFSLGVEGDEYDPDLVLNARFRAGFIAKLYGPKLRLIGEGDFLARRLSGEPTDVGTYRVDPELRRGEVFHPWPLALRKFYLEWQPFFGVLRLGQQTSQWGLGILAHGGDRPSDGVSGDGELFGDVYRGSVTQRALFATSPFQAIGASPTSVLGRLTLVVAGDVVIADETAQRFDQGLNTEDEAYQLVLSALVRPREYPGEIEDHMAPRSDLSGGFYGVRRTQKYAEGDQLDVWVLDTAVRYTQAWAPKSSLRYGLEAAYITGETDRIHTEGGPQGVDIEAYGLAMELEAAWPVLSMPLRLTALIGLASGDSDPDDGETNRFTFHGDYDVGAILFDQVVPALQRRATERVDDPLRAKEPPQGYQYFAGRGGVTGASYALLRTAIGPCHGFTAGVQAMTASTLGPFIDPYTTFASGGSPRNPFGGRGEGSFGTELEAAVRYAMPALGAGVQPAVRATYGVLLPGAVLRGPDAELGNVHLVQLKLSLDSALGGGR